MPLKSHHTAQRLQELVSKRFGPDREVVVQRPDGSVLDPTVPLEASRIDQVVVRVLDREESKQTEISRQMRTITETTTRLVTQAETVLRNGQLSQ